MKLAFSTDLLPENAILIACSSHEVRCRGMLLNLGNWKPQSAVLFHYDDTNPRREKNHKLMEEDLRKAGICTTGLQFTESNAVKSLHDNMKQLREVLPPGSNCNVVFDISVFTKRHLLMMLRWLDDEGLWDRLTLVYSEPEDYDVSSFIPLSFGLSSLQQIPGFSACADLSRPLHLVLFLGYEGDRAMAVYEHVQPMRATLVIPHPPYKPMWAGRTEELNADLLTVVDSKCVVKVDAIDPEATQLALSRILGPGNKRSEEASIICPLGTKPQMVGIYNYIRSSADPSAVIYASPLRHNHDFFSHGLGPTWILKRGK